MNLRLLLLCVNLLLVAVQPATAQCGACQYQAQLIQNGSFTQGNTGFTTSLNYVTGFFSCPLCPEGTYTVGANATLFHSGFIGTDHTNPPFGNFFIANAQGMAGSVVWCQSMSVQPNTWYQFSMWTRDVANNNNPHPLALLQLQWNGVLQQDTVVAAGGWQQYTTSWYSGNENVLELCIINQQWQTGGNDFGLDDISLTACHAYQPAHTAFAGEDTSICSGETVQIGMPAYSGYTYSWQGSDGLSSYTTSMPVVNVFNPSETITDLQYILTVDSAGVGCISMDTITVQILPMPPLSVSGNLMVCPSELTVLSVEGSWDAISWNNGLSEQQISVGAGNYLVETQYGICTASAQVVVQEVELPVINLGPDLALCSTQLPYTLDAGLPVQWNDASVGTQYIVTQSGWYSCIFEQEGCSTESSVQIQVTQVPQVVLPNTVILCEGSQLNLNSSLSGVWNTGAVGASIVVQEPGTYFIQVSDGPCEVLATCVVSLLQKPASNLPATLEVCEDEVAVLDAFAPQNTTYLWSDGSTSSSLETAVPGVYSVEVANQCGARSYQVELLNYPCNWGLFIPNTFSPNNDGINDGWMVKGFNISNLDVRIYNRLGDLVFYNNKMDAVWQPDLSVGQDVYNYRIEALDYYGRSITKLGYIYLLR